MTQTANSIIDTNRNLRITKWGIYLFLNRKRDKDCDNCGKKIRKLNRMVSRVNVKEIRHVFISYVCRRCY
ncbi:MAG TPA: hypothetical protein PKY82_21135 [Pyrinomonadaceae bacterium]|nr:hypothetical protein [Pyrinomonadaceae bacterium]HRH44150.1 hypothetical protein [Pyrinomonadaceae bacterium]